MKSPTEPTIEHKTNNNLESVLNQTKNTFYP